MTSVLSLTSVAVTRYLIISMPFTYSSKITPSMARFILGGVWLGSILLSFPPVTWRPTGIICKSGAVSNAYYTSELIYIIPIIPSTIMLISYIRIFGVTSYQIRRISTTRPVAFEGRHVPPTRRQLRAAMVLALIGGLFILCFVHHFLVYLQCISLLQRKLTQCISRYSFAGCTLTPLLILYF